MHLRSIVTFQLSPLTQWHPTNCFKHYRKKSVKYLKIMIHFSDVLCWIQGIGEIDIRSETPDETAMRLLNALRILKFPPPKDIEQV